MRFAFKAFRRDGVFIPPAQVVVSAAEVLEHALRMRQDQQEQVVIAIDAHRRYHNSRRQWRLNRPGVWIAADLPGAMGRLWFPAFCNSHFRRSLPLDR